ncbi:MAG TPA: Spy/CpxP family protein refolding chaperone [Desulfatiglandales bacterium]|nr:Spy/CpxP family protein refolding chaperone [Desulfatiglandales bacterium]
MKSKHTWIIVGAVVLAFGLLAGCGPHGFCDKVFSNRDSGERGAFHGRWGTHRFAGKDISEHIMKRFDERVEKLGLSEAQQKKYKEIRSKVETSLNEAKEEHRKLFEELRGEINRGNPDMNVAASLVKNRFKDMPDHLAQIVDYFMEFYNVLDEDQQAQVLDEMRDRMGRD